MPKGLKPKAAINKVFGEFLREGGFTLYRSIPPETYKYRSDKDGILGVLEIGFNWSQDIALRAGYKHFVTIRIDSKSGKNSSNLGGIVMGVKYPHLCVAPGQLYTPEQEEERIMVIRTDPMLDDYFVTQEELEEKLRKGLQALKEYGLPWLEKKEELLHQREQEEPGRL